MYRASDFDYVLPPERIAQHPLPDRADSRLLVLERATGAVRHTHFPAILDLLRPADVLVVNESRVIPARLRGTRDGGRGTGTPGAPAELLLVRELLDGTWLAMGHPGGKLKPGRRVTIGEDCVVEIVEVQGGGLRRVRFIGPLDARAALARYGEVPLPPYIRRAPRPDDRERYQTVYAQHDGSVAAPTAGLHFTPALLERVRATGTAVAALDLHIGPGTFKPVDELRKLYADAGVDGKAPIITYCRIGERSSHSWFVLKFLLGYDVRNYDGSWTEYGNAVGVPIVNEAGTVWTGK